MIVHVTKKADRAKEMAFLSFFVRRVEHTGEGANPRPCMPLSANHSVNGMKISRWLIL